MAEQFSYACKDYPGMESCQFLVNTHSEQELWQQMELHARLAHGEDPSQWTDDDKKYLKTLIKSGNVLES